MILLGERKKKKEGKKSPLRLDTLTTNRSYFAFIVYKVTRKWEEL